ncbi:hypothetical protein ADIAL_0971 [Alkalibacterium sp. AK22]|uniref:SMU1112c/YaeR family gloxylase I-like metalloprotein n=1 Tax=Alkalibacterium sp. AK22 TaxID=1229520 RepID=UPI00044A43F2|nr:VOC family protein [Alkalibacterium sp. AK22]EXJ23534.1 hypothetical protein ADIAL_0971 [Alkalibacterium sp. AK22]
MLFTDIHHVAIIASNYEKSRHFYSEILGMEIIREVYREERQSFKLDLRSGQVGIELFSFPSPPDRPSGPEATGLRHLCFAVDSVEGVVKYLKSRGIEVEEVRVDPYTEKRFTFFKDPDGLPLEIYAK